MRRYYIVITAMLLAACAGNQKLSSPPPSSSLVPDGKLWSSLFQQKAAEYKALCIQAFNVARWRLDESLLISSSKPRAIITDIDETFLDNSPYAVHRALQGKDYDPATWQEWTDKGIADTLNGAHAFFQYAASRNVEVFYITNRKEAERAGTLKNLQFYKFPFADQKHLILRQPQLSSSKEDRRLSVSANYEIILLLGDNLADFSSMFDGSKTSSEREAAVAMLAAQFGRKFIVLPNTNYGGWEDAIYGGRPLSPTQKDSAIKVNLKGY
ncbi:MAG: 5'-nucleotidase, lipoprotein e(P4) family [Chitinophagaceae bacterium]|nr:5'-nucleotidase, lipoprotein e(P4) family [Chitinophagaceae bacterium]